MIPIPLLSLPTRSGRSSSTTKGRCGWHIGCRAGVDPATGLSVGKERHSRPMRPCAGNCHFAVRGPLGEPVDLHLRIIAVQVRPPPESVYPLPLARWNLSSMSSTGVQSVFFDRSGNLWFGLASTGLDKYDFRSGLFTHFQRRPGDPHSISADCINGICEDEKRIPVAGDSRWWPEQA